ncbi:MAG TPA: hotdog domain-containing protein [Bacillota bacterium]|nr:hotdog domain-containing protein [Bacillota bacterium]
MEGEQVVLRFRAGPADAHYAGNLVAGGRILQWFGDAATALCIMHDGDEGLFVAYDRVEFVAPVHAGDFLEVRGRITRTGNTSRGMSFEAYKFIGAAGAGSRESAADVLEPPLLVARASGTCVVPAQRRRKRGETGG